MPTQIQLKYKNCLKDDTFNRFLYIHVLFKRLKNELTKVVYHWTRTIALEVLMIGYKPRSFYSKQNKVMDTEIT